MAAAAETCPVCGTDDGRPIHTKAKDPITHEYFRIVECPECHIAYTAPRPASLDFYYPQRYRGFGPLVTGVLASFYKRRVARWSRLMPKAGSVLEIGCGPGLMLAAFQRRGWHAVGIERDERVAARARQSHGLEVTTTPIEAMPEDVRFDLIVMFNVLEHIGEPMPLLRECVKRLSPSGRIIMSMHNFASWQAKFAGPHWFHLDPPRHLIHFTPETLAATLQQVGLKVVAIDHVSLEHDPYGWVESANNRLTGRANTITRFLMGIDTFGPAVMFSCVLAGVFALPALMLAVASWLAGKGALMEVTASLPSSHNP